MPNNQIINEIVQNLRSKSEYKPEDYVGDGNNLDALLTPSAEGAARLKRGKAEIDNGALQDVEFSVPKNAIYDRLSDGSYVAKFENYKGATGNEDRLAKEQSGLAQAGYGLVKNARKMGNYFLDATVGTVYGVINGINEGQFSGIWDNDFSNTMDDWNKQLDYNLPNYYTDEQKSMGFLRSLGTANFWFNDVANGLAFVGGALLPEIVLGAVTGGSSLSVGAGKIGLSLGRAVGKEAAELSLKQLAKNSVKQVDDFVNFSKGRDIIRNYQRAIYGKQAGDVISTAGFLLRSSNFEAGMEARSNFKEAVDYFYQTFEEKNGRPPTLKEISEFSNSARTASNWLYVSNLAILSGSNAAMFGKAFDLKLPQMPGSFNNFANRAIGLSTKKLDDGTLVLRNANKFQKGLGTAYKILEKPFIEGVYEEGLQGVAGKTMQKYLEHQYDPESVETYSLLAGLGDAFAEQYGTKEGWKEMGIGMLIGFAAGGITGQGLPGFGRNSRKTREAEIQGNIDLANQGIVTLKNMNRAASVRNFRNFSESSADKYQSSAIENTLSNITFIKSQEHLKTVSEIKNDFDSVIDNMVLDSEQLDQLNAADIDVDTYKQSLKEEFAQNIKDYNFAKKTVEAVGLNRRLKQTPGNIESIADALTINIALGKNALKSAQNISKQIDQLIAPGDEFQPGGIFDSLQFYNSLSADKKKAVSNLKSKQKRLADLQKTSLDIQQQLAGSKPKITDDAKLNRKYNNLAEKAVVTQQQIIETQNEIETLTSALNSEFVAAEYDLDGTLTSNPTDIVTALEEIEKLDNYIFAFRANDKNFEADSLEYLVQQFKFNSDVHREMINTQRRMLSTGFFESTEGKNIVNNLVGQKYAMSEEFKKIIRENDEIIDKSLQLFGIRGYSTVEELIEDSVEKNENLSEREKFKLEAIFRLQLNLKAVQQKLQEITDINVEYLSEKEISPDPLKGDTVRLRQALNIEQRDLSNIDILTQTIDEITSQLDFIRKKSDEKIDSDLLKTQIDKLTRQKEEILSNPESVAEQQQEIEEIEAEIKSLEEQLDKTKASYKIVDSPEYIRFTELAEKKETGILTEQEDLEFEELTKDIDQWLLISGVVVEGLRLSDLIRQRVVLEQTPVAPLEEVEEVVAQDILSDINFTDKTTNVNYMFGQTYGSVTATKDGDFISISGIKAATLMEEVGFQFDFETNERNNILLTEEVVQKINQESSVSILPTNTDLTSTYSVVIKHSDGISGGPKSTPMQSNYNEDFTKDQNPEAIYALEPGSPVILQVDPQDDYNVELISNYKKTLGVSSKAIDEDSMELLIDEIQTELGENDQEYQNLLKEEEKLKEAVSKADTTSKTAEARKNLMKFNNSGKLNRKEDQLRRQAEKEAKKRISAPGKAGNDSDAIEALKKSLVIRVNDTAGNFVAVLKAKSLFGNKTLDDQSFEIFRDNLVDDEQFIQQLLSSSSAFDLDTEAVSVKKVLLGHPNFNFIKNGDGSVGIQYRKITQSDLSKIVDLGYVENGNVRTKSNIKGIDTTFLNRFIERSKSNRKIPFIVFEKTGRRVAYPVRLIPQQKKDTTEFSNIFNSNVDITTKVNNLNRVLASFGIDIKQPGNAFTALGNTNLNQEFFNEKLAQIEAIDNFSPLTDWLSPENTMENILLDQVLINIDLSNPLHSPKLLLNFSEVFKKLASEKIRVSPIEAAQQVVNKKSKEVSSKALEELRKNC